MGGLTVLELSQYQVDAIAAWFGALGWASAWAGYCCWFIAKGLRRRK